MRNGLAYRVFLNCLCFCRYLFTSIPASNPNKTHRLTKLVFGGVLTWAHHPVPICCSYMFVRVPPGMSYNIEVDLKHFNLVASKSPTKGARKV